MGIEIHEFQSAKFSLTIILRCFKCAIFFNFINFVTGQAGQKHLVVIIRKKIYHF